MSTHLKQKVRYLSLNVAFLFIFNLFLFAPLLPTGVLSVKTVSAQLRVWRDSQTGQPISRPTENTSIFTMDETVITASPANSGRTCTANGSDVNGKICNPIKATSINNLLTDIMTVVKFVAGILLVIFFIYAGLKYVLARGDVGKIEEATRMLTWTAVGGAILLGAEVIQKLLYNTISTLGN
ncbi:MAG: hypothetical protein WCG97_01775 [bacterium]